MRVVSLGSGRLSCAVLVVSTAALLLLEARSLRVRRRVPAHHVRALSLSPHRDCLLHVHVLPRPGHDHPDRDQPFAPYSPYATDEPDAPGCLFGVTV